MTPLARQVLTLGGTCTATVAILAAPLLLAAAVLCEWWATRTPPLPPLEAL